MQAAESNICSDRELMQAAVVVGDQDAGSGGRRGRKMQAAAVGGEQDTGSPQQVVGHFR